jgi:hypothetical protein
MTDWLTGWLADWLAVSEAKQGSIHLKRGILLCRYDLLCKFNTNMITHKCALTCKKYMDCMDDPYNASTVTSEEEMSQPQPARCTLKNQNINTPSVSNF